MAQIPNLDNAAIDLASLREQSKKELITILKNIRGKKCLVIDSKLSGSLSLIVQASLLKEHGVELRILSAEPLQTECTKVVYLVCSRLDLMKYISLHLHDNASKGLQRKCFLYFVPQRSVACEQLLKEEKVHDLLTIGEYPLYMIPLDEDVISFELDFAYKECLVDADTSSLWHMAKAIHKLELSFGVIPNIRAKGKASLSVAEILDRMHLEEPANISDVMPEIGTVILLDREVDMVTPMFSQLTYEGVLDEILHVNDGAVMVDASIMGGQPKGKKIRVPLNSSDKLYKETRDLNFIVVCQILNQKALSMQKGYEGIETNPSVSDLSGFVKKLVSLPEMTRHIHLADHLQTLLSKSSFFGRVNMEQTMMESESYDICFEYIEDMIHKQEPLVTVLRLLILSSVTNSGLPQKHYDHLRRELLHSYGFEHVAILKTLEKAGLFRKQEVRSTWLTVKRALHLVDENLDTTEYRPNDIFSNYSPLSVHLIQQAIRSGWRPIEEILKFLPGPHLETKRGALSQGSSYESLLRRSTTADRAVVGRRSVVLVVFIGGVTFAEISALRFLSSQDQAYDIIIATTKVINGHTLLQPFVELQG